MSVINSKTLGPNEDKAQVWRDDLKSYASDCKYFGTIPADYTVGLVLFQSLACQISPLFSLPDAFYHIYTPSTRCF